MPSLHGRHRTLMGVCRRTSSCFTPPPSSPASTLAAPWTPSSPSTPSPSASSISETLPRPKILVAGALAVDFSCDYTPFANSPSQTDPLPHTSNPATIHQTLGGVAHNIAKAAHLLGADVRLHSAVGDDLSGRAALNQLQEEGMSVTGIETLPKPARTAQYVAINNVNKDLSLAMADMSILEQISQARITSLATAASTSRPSIFIADANWTSAALHTWFHAFRHPSTTTIFEPVSTAKSLRIFPTNNETASPHSPLADIITPNAHELSALYEHALSTSLFDTPHWFAAIDALGIPDSGLRVPLAYATSSALVDQGVPQMGIKLLPFFPTVLVKLGAGGVLLIKMLRTGAKELQNEDEKQHILARNKSFGSDASVTTAGLYIRLFPPDTILSPRDIRSVNGAGDTFCGAVAAALSRGMSIQHVIPFAQRAAGLSLKSMESVSAELKGMDM